MAIKQIFSNFGLLYKSILGTPAAKTPAQILVGAKGAAPIAAVPQLSAYQKLSTGLYGIKNVAAGRIVSTGAKVGIGARLAGAGLTGAAYGLEQVSKPISGITDPIDALVGFSGVGTIAIIGIIILVLILLLRRK